MIIITSEFEWPMLLVGAVFVFVLTMITSLTVEIKEGLLEARFGIGAIRKRVRLEEIESYKRVKYPWYYGYGIRLTPHGWLYNIYGRDAVEITQKNGKTFLIGTNDPSGLEMALKQAIGR